MLDQHSLRVSPHYVLRVTTQYVSLSALAPNPKFCFWATGLCPGTVVQYGLATCHYVPDLTLQ